MAWVEAHQEIPANIPVRIKRVCAGVTFQQSRACMEHALSVSRRCIPATSCFSCEGLTPTLQTAASEVLLGRAYPDGPSPAEVEGGCTAMPMFSAEGCAALYSLCMAVLMAACLSSTHATCKSAVSKLAQ